ncbi:hypothetical protein [Streptomyces sp. GESEQ-35]|uniref:hypothetical protein n=1 Tax=Streptomyces sp. GESEQ-35 TaxID=2812657 RepID=UPI001B32CF45|nr:hypothetical protein [Streptomyces sp. GESEQ-35]
MNEEQGQEPGADQDFEEQLRELLAEDAYTIRPSPAPYPSIRRRGAVERRRRVTVAGVALATLAAVPAGAIAVTGGGSEADTATPTPSVSATRQTIPTPTPTPSGPEGPATPGQLLDGLTLGKAASWLEDCIDYDRSHGSMDGSALGDAADYRILLGMRSTGDSNSPGDGFYIVAVKEKQTPAKVICHITDGEASGISSSVGEDPPLPDAGPVQIDVNDYKLYQQSILDKGSWKLPFRWGSIGKADSNVTKVTVTYGGRTSQAVLDHGWFVASGILTTQITRNPHVKGYDAEGRLVYDSDNDQSYIQTPP